MRSIGQYTGTSVARVIVQTKAMAVAFVAEYQNLNSAYSVSNDSRIQEKYTRLANVG